mgnify:CR=1 FL=1
MRLRTGWGLLGLLCFVSIPPLAVAADLTVNYITPAELLARLDSPEVVVIDVSPPSVYATYDRKIKGARRELPGRASEWGRQYPPEKTLVLYCHCSQEFASRQVAEILHLLGHPRVLVLQGGWEAWVKNGYPTDPK